MRCLTNVTLIYVNKQDYLKQFLPVTLQKMRGKHCDEILMETIKNNIE